MKKAIEIKRLEKSYGTNFHLGPVNIDIKAGSIVGLVGENGAGKTTLLKSILNILHIDEGEVKIFGMDYTHEDEIKSDIGVVLDDMFLPEILYVKDLDSIMESTFKTWDKELFYNYLRDFNIDASKQIKTLSKGMRKKLEIVVALSHKPKLLILDEPTSGLDPIVRNEILDIFLKFISDEEHTILLSTHITSDLEHIADEIIFLDKGNVILHDSRDNIIDTYGLIKCSKDDIKNIDKKDIVSQMINKYDCEVLVNDRAIAKKKYPKMVIDKMTIEELMLMMIKGDK